MTKLPPSQFKFSNYEGNTIPFSIAAGENQAYINFLLESNIIGYCESANCPVRIKPGEMAVMIEEDGYETWAHVPIEIWNEFMKQRK